MDIIVCIKQNVDMKQIRIKKDTREAVLEGLPLLFGDMDKNALEEAVRLKEKAGSGKVTALALGSAKLKDTIKDALAGGAAFLIHCSLRRNGGLFRVQFAHILHLLNQNIPFFF